MNYVLLVYGLAFFLLGSTLALESRSPLRALPRRPLWLLAAFGLVHGAAEWISLAVRLEAGTPREPALRVVFAVAVGLSFALLLQFAVEMHGQRRRPTWRRFVPALLVVLWAGSAAVSNEPLAFDALRRTEIIARYALGLPGALWAGLEVLLLVPRSADDPRRRQRRYCVATAVAFVAYAVLAGLIGPPGAFPPASVLSSEWFHATTGVPVEIFRAGCAVAIAFLLAEVFVVEAARVKARSDRERELFISVVAHELRNVMNVVNLAASALAPHEGVEPDPQVAEAMSERLTAGTRTLSRMLDDLLEASRLGTKQMALRPEPVDLRELVSQAVERAGTVTQGHPVKLTLPAEAAQVRADSTRLEQVLINLLSNAGKYAYPDVAIEVSVERRNRELVTSVANEGLPLSPEDLSDLFTPFYRAKSAKKSGTHGLGLGLYIARGLIEAHGGRMWVEALGDKTTFYFALPASMA